jgi:hypothetical protein
MISARTASARWVTGLTFTHACSQPGMVLVFAIRTTTVAHDADRARPAR